MKQTEVPLYPKISSIYNKIMQLAIAIVFIVITMNLWLATGQKDKQMIEQQFSHLSHEYLSQAASAVEVFLVNNETKLLHQYINKLSNEALIKSVHFYDKTGRLLFSSVADKKLNSKTQQFKNDFSINDLYGISPQKENESAIFPPFVQEIRTTKLLGYLRITVEKSAVNHTLIGTKDDRQQLIRLMLILAGFAGFLLTRGLNRFSRQGYRVPKKLKAKSRIAQ